MNGIVSLIQCQFRDSWLAEGMQTFWEAQQVHQFRGRASDWYNLSCLQGKLDSLLHLSVVLALFALRALQLH